MLQARHTSWLLIFFGGLILGHLGIIYADVYLCGWYGTQLVHGVGTAQLDVFSSDCDAVEETYQEAVDKYLAIVLALLSGGAAGVAATVKTKKDDEDGV